MADVSSLAGWARKWRRPLDNGRWIWHTAARAQQITSTFASDSGIGYENELEIAARNAGEWFLLRSALQIAGLRVSLVRRPKLGNSFEAATQGAQLRAVGNRTEVPRVQIVRPGTSCNTATATSAA